MPIPCHPVPVLRVPTLAHGPYELAPDEPARFAEPGVLLERPDGTLHHGAVQTMPFARPRLDELLAAADFAIARDDPARGEYAGEL